MRPKNLLVIAGLFLAALFLVSSTSAQPKGRVVEVPFELYKNEVLVEVRINGRGPFTMMLDTGTDPSAIDLTTAAAIGIKRSSKGQQGEGGGTDTNLSYECKFATLDLGSLSAKDVDAAAIDLSKINARMERHIDGVLGHSLLNKRIVQLDYPGRLVRFFDRMPPATSPTATIVRFHYSDDLLIDGVLVNGKAITANLDTGSSGTFALSPKAVEDLGLTDEAAKGKVTSSVGYNGQFENHEGTLKNVAIGSISLDAPSVIYFGKGSGHDKVPWGVNIGNAFLKDFIVTIDYRDGTVRFEKPGT